MPLSQPLMIDSTNFVEPESIGFTSFHFMDYESAFDDYIHWPDEYKSPEGIQEDPKDLMYPYYFEVNLNGWDS